MISYDPRLPAPPNDEYQKRLSKELNRALRDLGSRLDLLAAGRLTGTPNASTVIPTTGTHAAGDFVRKSDPVEAGSAGSKYIIFGWMCTAGGTPGTWLSCRFLTGN